MKIHLRHEITVEMNHEEVVLACQEYLTRKFAEQTAVPVGWNRGTCEFVMFKLEPGGVVDQVSAFLTYGTPMPPKEPVDEEPMIHD